MEYNSNTCTLCRTGHARPSRDRLPRGYDVGPDGPATTGRAISQASLPLRDATPDAPPGLWWDAWLRGRGLGRCGRTLACCLGLPLAGRQQEAAAEQIEARAAKHLALQHLEAIDVPLDRAGTPGQGDARFDGFLVVAEPGGEASHGLQGTRGRTL